MKVQTFLFSNPNTGGKSYEQTTPRPIECNNDNYFYLPAILHGIYFIPKILVLLKTSMAVNLLENLSSLHFISKYVFSFLGLLVWSPCYSHEPSGNAMFSIPLSSFIPFPSSGLGRAFLSILTRSASRFLASVASFPNYNGKHQTLENITFAK